MALDMKAEHCPLVIYPLDKIVLCKFTMAETNYNIIRIVTTGYDFWQLKETHTHTTTILRLPKLPWGKREPQGASEYKTKGWEILNKFN